MDLTHSPAGKTYKALLAAGCKEFDDGGCTLFEYRLLCFKKDSVDVSLQVIANCLPEEREIYYNRLYDTKTYKWKINNNIITIEGLGDYGKLKFRDSMLIGEEIRTREKIEFNEAHK
ncbi:MULTISPECIES: hypothetical protein [Niastella]|uniref:Uncharacterized protein n=1 Tax=Niastella soli TaxID=2821487 RepID=A0ABS3Z463_9BACT|nr:hypothetical protein [Niastella soli]MBO9204949.1 hypothetical protein [Niastella soli]